VAAVPFGGMRLSIREGTTETARSYTRTLKLEANVMKRTLIPLTLAALLCACGAAETASTAATIAESEAEQAKQAQQMKAKIEQRIDDAEKTARQQRDAAEAASQ